MAPAASTGISWGHPELQQLRRLRRLWRLRRLQEFLGDPQNYSNYAALGVDGAYGVYRNFWGTRNYGAYGVYDAYGACKLGQAPNPNPYPNPNSTLTQYLAQLYREIFQQNLAWGAAPPMHPPALLWALLCSNIIIQYSNRSL